MATSTISNTVTGPTGTVVSGARVVARLMPSAGFRVDTFSEVARVVETVTNGSGAWSLALERNTNITPASTYYQITELIPNSSGGPRVWNISVGASNQTVLAALVDPLPDATSGTYLTQASADARYQAVGSLGSGTPSTIEPDDAGTAGVSTSASRADHEHPAVASAPSDIGLAGTNTEGAATSFARSNHIHGHNPPACRVFHNANQSIAVSAVSQILAFNSERYDTSTMHDPAANTKITIPTAGLYLVTAGVEFASNATGYRQIELLVGGATFIGIDNRTAVNGDTTKLNIATVYKFTAGQYIEVRALQNSGGALNVTNFGQSSPEFSATWVGVG